MEYKKILNYRFLWMALAMLWIVFRHIGIKFDNSIIEIIKQFGYGGVDIFLFASGIGCYYSLSKDDKIESFIKKRFIKIMPMYLIFILFWITGKIIINDYNIGMIIGNIFCIQSLTGKGNDFNWYISAIWIFYLLAPYFYKFTKNNNCFNNLKILILCCLISIPFWNVDNLIVIFSRLPIFVLGMIFGEKSLESKTMKKNKIVTYILVSLLGIVIMIFLNKYDNEILWNYGLYWYPFILITPGICILISMIAEWLSKYKIQIIILNVFKVIGNNTLSIYLIHLFIFDVIKILIQKNIFVESNMIWILSLIPISIFSMLLTLTTNFITKNIKLNR